MTIFSLLTTTSPRLKLWSPACLMLGIALYFALENEPPYALGPALLAAILIPFYLLRNHPIRRALWPPFLIILGFTAAQLRAHIVETPLLTQELKHADLTGTIDEIEPVEQRIKLVLSRPVIEGLPPAQTPLRLRVSFRATDLQDLQAGDRVHLLATLYPLPQPSLPGGYAFSRHFYFRSIGGNGYALSPPEIIEGAKTSSLRIWLNSLRHKIGDDMRAHMPGPAGAVAAGMTVGETGPIPLETKNLLRDSGLAHMLAIAGLHLGIVAGLIFFNVRLAITLYPPLAMRVSAKKIAAAVALLSAFIYLLLAGMPVPAQRAFIMVAILFTSFLLGRSRTSLYTLMLAAWLILLVFPEAMFGASFELSFAATLAIISLFETFRHQLHPSGNWQRRLWRHGLGILATSLIATCATAPFVLYNFNRLASFGLIANMLVIPLATFMIMPSIVLALLLMPLGLQAIAYVPLALSVEWMLALAAWVTNLPYASLRLPAPTDGGLMLCTLGLLLICLLRSRWRLIGAPLMLLGLAPLQLHQSPDILISHDGKQVMARLENGTYAMLKGSPASFTAQAWLHSEGKDEALTAQDAGLDCGSDYCQLTQNGATLLLVKAPYYADISKLACQQTVNALIAWQYLHPYNCPGPKLIIGRAELETYGAHALYIKNGNITISRTIEQKGKRLWDSQ